MANADLFGDPTRTADQAGVRFNKSQQSINKGIQIRFALSFVSNAHKFTVFYSFESLKQKSRDMKKSKKIKSPTSSFAFRSKCLFPSSITSFIILSSVKECVNPFLPGARG